ncbi:MerR family transcriptional regulator [Acinetobacter sp. ANC 4636]|uniref:MerR family transcriptional regulator n=1 Tax=unclassified Acinetobacter TaxID=196816 RepID=UPI0002CF63E5|nr:MULTISPECIES: MerR family transcriptional regulator [unclassified Acinetobacter]ENU81897.1 Cd(II)/Pb(II)-responsive transcriptional regulator [Acinetobacter sp. ANC 3789]TCB29579.1 MerR family transcriptional regulator [Acinetobacter sp. ANC 4635]
MFFSIGELAKKSKISADTIRFYEKKQLITAPKRANNNYRYYDDQALQQLIFIRHCRELGMSLKEIQEMNALMLHPQDNCTVVDTLVETHLGHIQDKIQQLQKFSQQLQQLRQSCNSQACIQDCNIVKTLHQLDAE